MGILNIYARFGSALPAGDFVAWLDGTKYATSQEVARAVFLERGATQTQLLAQADEHFANGFRGTTADEFHVSVLRAFDRPIPEYPPALREEHEARARRFWNGVESAKSRSNADRS